jgi:hypothetical protein
MQPNTINREIKWMSINGVEERWIENWIGDRGATKPAKYLEKELKERYYFKLSEETKATRSNSTPGRS